jgi:ABC-2 type transport system ATP-binding protein
MSFVAGVLKASHLTRRFGERIAVDDVSFDLAPGEIFALLGPNGAGKTTTLRMLAGLIEPSSGTVALDGETVTSHTSPRLRGQIGFLTEAPGLWDRLTTRQNLMVYARLHGLADPGRAVDAALDCSTSAIAPAIRPRSCRRG